MPKKQIKRETKDVVISHVTSGGSWGPGESPVELVSGGHRVKFNDHPFTLRGLVDACKGSKR